MPRFCSKCKMDKGNPKYHTKLPGLGYFCHRELFYIDKTGNEVMVPPGQEKEYEDVSYLKRITDE